MRYFICVVLMTLGLNSFSQTGKLTIHGRVENENATIPYVSVAVVQNNELVKELVTLRNGSYRLDLDLGSVYNIEFTKEGFVGKSVAVIGKADSTINGRYFFQLDVEIFRLDQEDIDETMLPPVAKLYIKSEEEGFTYDKKYVKWISNHYDDLEE